MHCLIKLPDTPGQPPTLVLFGLEMSSSRKRILRIAPKLLAPLVDCVFMYAYFVGQALRAPAAVVLHACNLLFEGGGVSLSLFHFLHLLLVLFYQPFDVSGKVRLVHPSST